VNQVFPEDHIS